MENRTMEKITKASEWFDADSIVSFHTDYIGNGASYRTDYRTGEVIVTDHIGSDTYKSMEEAASVFLPEIIDLAVGGDYDASAFLAENRYYALSARMGYLTKEDEDIIREFEDMCETVVLTIIDLEDGRYYFDDELDTRIFDSSAEMVQFIKEAIDYNNSFNDDAETMPEEVKVTDKQNDIIAEYVSGTNAIVRLYKNKCVIECPEDDYEFESIAEAIEVMEEAIAEWKKEDRKQSRIGKAEAFYTGGGIWISAMWIDENRYCTMDNSDYDDTLVTYDNRDEDDDIEFPCQNPVDFKHIDDMDENEKRIFCALKAELERVMC